MNYSKTDVTFIIPSRENLHFLKYAYDSIRRNIGIEPYILCADDYSIIDGSKFWMEEIKKTDKRFDFIVNKGPERLGHVILFNQLVERVKTKLFVLSHADMVWLKGSLDGLLEFMKPKTIVSATRCEPASLHPPEKCKISLDWLPTDPKDLDEERLQQYTDNIIKTSNIHYTEGIFAPYLMETDEYLKIGGCDSLFRPTSREDDDLWNRLLLNGCEFIQSWKSYVFHRSCAGSRWNPTLTTVGKNSEEWDKQQSKSLRNYIRKWKSIPLHDSYHYPIFPKKQYNIGFILQNPNYEHIYHLEPWCSRLVLPTLDQKIIDNYIENEQPNTPFNLKEKLEYSGCETDIIVEIDGRTFNIEDFKLIQQLSMILEDSGEIGEFKLGNLKITVRSLQTYEHELIVCKNEPIKLED